MSEHRVDAVPRGSLPVRIIEVIMTPPLVAGSGLMAWAYTYPAASSAYLIAGILLAIGLAMCIPLAVLVIVGKIRSRAPWIVLGTLAALAIVCHLHVPLEVRFALSQSSFEEVIDRAGQPEIPACNPNDLYGQWFSFPGECPERLGSYLIRDCEGFPGGYLFYTEASAGLADHQGFAYMPKGVPASPGLVTDDFEDPSFTNLGGAWYGFTASW
jgi:hypothetical protein